MQKSLLERYQRSRSTATAMHDMLNIEIGLTNRVVLADALLRLSGTASCHQPGSLSVHQKYVFLNPEADGREIALASHIHLFNSHKRYSFRDAIEPWSHMKEYHTLRYNNRF